MSRAFLIAAAAATALVAGPAGAGGAAWLDAPAPKGWNKAGGPIPRPPRFDPDPFLAKRCADQVRAPITDADLAVAKRGWKLMGAEPAFGDTEVVLARTGVDGMCRPLGYQAFVFAGGKFAGTLAPRSMDSRSDGAAQVPRLDSATELTATYARYAPRDPLCCPSRLSTVRFRIDSTPAGPVVVPVSITTVATEPAVDAKPSTVAPPAASATSAVARVTGPAGRTWQLVRIRMPDGTVLVPDEPARFTVALGPEGSAAVGADCNRANGAYTLSGSSLTFGPMAATRAMCPPGSLSDRYLAQLAQVASWTERDGRLFLATRADGATLEFEPVP